MRSKRHETAAGPRSRPRPPVYDAIVVGARVAGASTAMLMARQGLRVLLVDRAPEPGTDTLSTHALMRAGVFQLDRWGVLADLRAAGTPAIRRTTIHYGDEAQIVDIKPRAGVDALYGPRRTVLDPLLVQAAAKSGVEIRFGVTVRRLLREGSRVVGIEARAENGRALRAFAPWVVGADGLGSRVAREVEAPVTWQGTASGGFLYGYWTGLPFEGYEWFYRPGVTAGIIPTNDGACCVWVSTPTSRFMEEIPRDLEGGYRTLLEEAAPKAISRLDEGRRVGRLRGFPGLPGFLRKPRGPGWALVGDAGSFRDPISAHGITDALRDAELLARAIVANLGSRDGSLEPLAWYERRRDEASLRLAEITDQVASYDWDVPKVQELLLAMAKAMGHELELLESLPDEFSAAA